MKTYAPTLLAGAFALSLLVLSGCADCQTTAKCPPPPPPPVAVARPAPPPPPPAPTQGVCWIAPEGDVLLPNPPTVTVNQSGAVVSRTQTGRLTPPSVDYAFVGRPVVQ